MVLDYVLAALNGLNSDKYVPHSKSCVNNTKYFQIDFDNFLEKCDTTPKPRTGD